MRAERLVALLFTLQSKQSTTIAELADALAVSERTMHRDLASLKEAGVPLWTEQGRNGGVGLVPGWRARLDGLTAREAVAIFALGVPRALAEIGLGTAVSAAYAKVSAGMPAHLREQANQVAGRFHLDAPAWFREADNTPALAPLAEAVWTQRRLRIHYGRKSEVVERVAEPLGLVLKAGAWYLVARIPAGSTLRTYRVGRIIETVALGETFDRPNNFDLAEWWKDSAARFEGSLHTGRARIKLSATGRRMLPKVVDPDIATDSLATAAEPDAEGWAELILPIERHDIAVGQLTTFGAEIEILEPNELRAAIAEIGSAMAARNGVT